MSRKKSQTGLVYSTEAGRLCPNCNQPVSECRCREETIPEHTGPAKITRETKGRKGKGVSIVNGLPLTEKDLKQVAKKLKSRCGTGGTVKNGTIEIQGDCRELIREELKKLGYDAKIAGG